MHCGDIIGLLPMGLTGRWRDKEQDKRKRCKVHGTRYKVQGTWCKVQGARCRVQGTRCKERINSAKY